MVRLIEGLDDLAGLDITLVSSRRAAAGDDRALARPAMPSSIQPTFANLLALGRGWFTWPARARLAVPGRSID